jgi:hypothetical protein
MGAVLVSDLSSRRSPNLSASNRLRSSATLCGRLRLSAALAVSMAALASVPANAAAPSYEIVSVPDDNYTEVTNGPPSGPAEQTPLTVTTHSTTTSFSSQEVGGSSAFENFGVGEGFDASAGASASGTASAGLLVGIAEANASIAPTFYGAGFTSEGPNPFVAIASADYIIQFGDSLRLTSSKLKAGTPVTWTFTVGFHTVRTTTGDGSASAIISGSAGSLSTTLTNPVMSSPPEQGPLTEMETITASGVVGQVVSIGESLQIVAGAEAENQTAGIFGSGTGILDATDTGFFYADPVTAGLELVSASGHDYATPGVGTPTVPEPSTWVMILMGFAGLGYAALRRRAGGVRVAITPPLWRGPQGCSDAPSSC